MCFVPDAQCAQSVSEEVEYNTQSGCDCEGCDDSNDDDFSIVRVISC
jgi:hypothetical protein